MKILDRYLVKQFVQIIFFGIIAFALIFVVIDMMENLDDFIDQGVPFLKVIHFYVVFIPEIVKLITPVSVLFAALFTAGKAANLSELTAMNASGISMFRFMIPFLITAFIVSLISVGFSGYIVPMANAAKVNIEVQYLKRGVNFAGSNIYFQESKTRIVNISFFDNTVNQAVRVSMQQFDENDVTKMTARTDAEKMTYDSLSRSWTLFNGVTRNFSDSTESAEYFTELKMKGLNFSPSDLNSKQQKKEQMNIPELKELIRTQENAGIDPTDALIEYYSRFSFSMASFICVLFGLPISSNRRKGGMAAQVGLNILVTFLYLVFMKISQAFGSNGSMDPLLTAWLANIIFIFAALYNLPKMRQ